MSLTVVASLPKSVPTPVNESPPEAIASADGAASGQDFMGLLLTLAQQLATTAAVTPTASASEDLAAADKSDALGTETTAGDPGNLLAALGIIPVELRRDAGTGRGNDAVHSDAVGSGQTGGALGVPNTITENRAETTASLPTGDTSLMPQGKTAKFAGDAASLATSDIKSGKEGVVESSLNPTPIATPDVKTGTALHDTPLAIRTPVQTTEWNHDFGQKIVWMATHDKQSAQITLNPEQMGPIEVSLSVDKGNVTASFASSSADVREAIETALPRLREMFASAGIELGQANVSAESFKQSTTDQGSHSNRSPGSSGNGILATSTAASTTTGIYATRQGNGLVDIFA